MKREDFSFDADGVNLRGWLFRPDASDTTRPAIVMSHGYGAVKEMFLDRFAARFADAGFVVLAYDHRNFGASDGMPRQEIDPWRQIEDMRHAVTALGTAGGVDPSRIGAWGTSYSGGHVLALAATDRRVKCVVSQVPTIDGTESGRRRVDGERLKDLLDSFAADRRARQSGEPPALLSIIPDDTRRACSFRFADAIAWYSKGYTMAPAWKNEVTLRSVEWARGYNPGAFISLISPVPLLMIVADQDHVTPTDLALAAYEKALSPKRLELLRGGHFDAYEKAFDQCASVATEWFSLHL